MTEQAKQARRKYKNEWNRKNRDKCRQYEAKHWEKVAAEKQAQEQEGKG